MIEQLQEKQRKLLAMAKQAPYTRSEYSFVNSDERLIALIGARGVGKTTLLLQYIAQYSIDEALYFSADDISIAAFGIVEIVEEFYKLGGRIVVIDEVHMFKEWAAHVKNLYDFFPDLTLRISGSSMVNIVMQSHDLSRRIVTKELQSLRFKEYFEMKYTVVLPEFELEELLSNHNALSFELTQQYPHLYKSFKEYLKHGAYPFFMNTKNEENFANKLFNAIEKIIYEDIPATNSVKFENLTAFKRLIYAVVAAKVPYLVKIDALAKELSVSEPTLYVYLSLLDKTGIFRTLKKQSAKQSKKPEKLYFKNTNILYALAKDQGLDVDIGTVRETFFASCFKNIFYSEIGDFNVNGTVFEVGGKGKSFDQIKETPKSYLAIDVDTTAHKHKVPLWMFGLLA
ncbi:MAG: ATP-binding protein [Campylobacterales bacterium]|nr:ATP-binding protein [Campylobacterales bacterium]